RAITDFRLVQRSTDLLELILPPDLPEPAAAAPLAAIENLLKQRGHSARIALIRKDLNLDPSRKMRRVECAMPKHAGPPRPGWKPPAPPMPALPPRLSPLSCGSGKATRPRPWSPIFRPRCNSSASVGKAFR